MARMVAIACCSTGELVSGAWWSGSFYAVEPIERLGLAASGGLVRVGLCHYSNAEEVDRLLSALSALA